MIHWLILSGILLATLSSSLGSVDLLSEIQAALAGHEDVSYVLDYLKLSQEQLAKDLPSGNGETYTFFAPNNNAIIFSLPQDVVDPFIVDSQFRHKVLLAHFVRQDLPDFVFRGKFMITMANDNKYPLALNPEDGGVRLNGANILGVIPLETMGNIYVIDEIFADQEDIYEAIGNVPPKFGPLGEPLTNLLFSEINFALRKRPDTTYIREYLDLSYDELGSELPSGFYLPDSHEKTSYTFFAPTDDAIATALPQDVSNPFYDNDQFRRNVLLAHFVRHRLSDEEFRQRSVLTMANNETAVITRSAGGSLLINRATIVEKIPLATTGTVYLIDYLMTDQDEIYKAISSNQTFDPWGIPFDNNSSEQQVQQVDIIAELLLREKQEKEKQ